MFKRDLIYRRNFPMYRLQKRPQLYIDFFFFLRVRFILFHRLCGISSADILHSMIKDHLYRSRAEWSLSRSQRRIKVVRLLSVLANMSKYGRGPLLIGAMNAVCLINRSYVYVKWSEVALGSCEHVYGRRMIFAWLWNDICASSRAWSPDVGRDWLHINRSMVVPFSMSWTELHGRRR